jgi:hypothetical protein
MDLVFGGWQLTGINVLQSGLQLTANLGGSTVPNLGSERRARPSLVGIARDSSGFGQILTAANARLIQFGLKFYF